METRRVEIRDGEGLDLLRLLLLLLLFLWLLYNNGVFSVFLKGSSCLSAIFADFDGCKRNFEKKILTQWNSRHIYSLNYCSTGT